VSLAHHIDMDLLREAYRRTRKDGAPGVDGKTAADYEEILEENLQSLLDRFTVCPILLGSPSNAVFPSRRA